MQPKRPSLLPVFEMQSVCLNAKLKTNSAEELFIELLEQYKLPNNLLPLIEI
jgi:hypothetical protein